MKLTHTCMQHIKHNRIRGIMHRSLSGNKELGGTALLEYTVIPNY